MSPPPDEYLDSPTGHETVPGLPTEASGRLTYAPSQDKLRAMPMARDDDDVAEDLIGQIADAAVYGLRIRVPDGWQLPPDVARWARVVRLHAPRSRGLAGLPRPRLPRRAARAVRRSVRRRARAPGSRSRSEDSDLDLRPSSRVWDAIEARALAARRARR